MQIPSLAQIAILCVAERIYDHDHHMDVAGVVMLIPFALNLLPHSADQPNET